jgi:hypothetical protein
LLGLHSSSRNFEESSKEETQLKSSSHNPSPTTSLRANVAAVANAISSSVEKLLFSSSSQPTAVSKDRTNSRDVHSSKKGANESTRSLSNRSNRRSSVVAKFAAKEVPMEHYLVWAQQCLLDDIAKHVHEVVRLEFSFHKRERQAPFEAFLSSPELAQRLRALVEQDQARSLDLSENSSGRIAGRTHRRNGSSGNYGGSVSSPHGSLRIGGGTSSITNVGENRNGSFVKKMRTITGRLTTRELKQHRHHEVLHSDAALVSELRNVIVLFINVRIKAANLYHDPNRGDVEMPGATDEKEPTHSMSNSFKKYQTCKIPSFHFLSRTVDEIEADKKLVNQFQLCIHIITDVLQLKGGQLRQFIVDDKGTVSIATFGLRGSVNYDNAAAAVEAADLIVTRLKEHDIDASVGTTSGAAYCGLVGSNTNLSARLMGRAGPGEILCDAAIRQRDRIHSYISLGAVQAKGYTAPVPIFKPNFKLTLDAEQSRSFIGHIANTVAVSAAADSPLGTVTHTLSYSVTGSSGSRIGAPAPTEWQQTEKEELAHVFGRKKEASEMFEFLFQSAVKSDFNSLTRIFWVPSATETPVASCVQPLDEFPSFPHAKLRRSGTANSVHSAENGQFFPSAATEVAAVAGVPGYRFSISEPSKKVAICATTGLGKTALIDLFQAKINGLVVKNSSFYNVKIFRHQFGYINSTTLFSAWFCIIRQLLFSIAESIADYEGLEFSQKCRTSLSSEDNAYDLLQKVSLYLPEHLRPFMSLLHLLGINTAKKVTLDSKAPRAHHDVPVQPSSTSKTASMTVSFAAAKVSVPTTLHLNYVQEEEEDEDEIDFSADIDSDKTDATGTLDASEKLRLCAEIVVALIQLHVTMTHKLTVIIMYVCFFFLFFFL